MTYLEARAEKNRIIDKIHGFCRGETMVGKGCVNCPINYLDVCNDHGTKCKIDMKALREAEKVIDEVMQGE